MTPSNAEAHGANVDTVPLDKALAEVKAALDDYQNMSPEHAIPPIKSADFAFKTTSTKEVGGGFSILIFKFNAKRDAEDTSELKFHYEPPKVKALLAKHQPPPLRAKLVDLLLAAGTAAAHSGKLGNIPLSSVTVTVAYGVTWTVDAAGGPVIQLVTLSLTGEYRGNVVQTVTLTFGE